MVKLMIIDDEEEIRQGIRNVIDWESNGILVCGEAPNGKEALRLLRELSPDILLVDIRMPVMDGLQLIEIIKDINFPAKSIILSGYDDFSYAQKALKLGATDYLLKPCRPEEILETVLKVKALIENEKKRNETFARLNAQFRENLPVLKERFLYKLLTGEKKQMRKILEMFELLKINLKADNITVMILRIDNFPDFCEHNSNSDIELMKFAIKNISEEILLKAFQCEVIECDDDIVIILTSEVPHSNEDIVSFLNEIRFNIKKFLDFSVSIGIGRSYTGINNIHLSYKEALEAIEGKFFIGDNALICYEDIHNRCVKEFYYPIIEEKEILKCIRKGDGNEVSLRLEEFFSALNPDRISKDDLINSGLALVFSMYHLCIELNIEVSEIFGNGFHVFANIQKIDSLSQLKETINNITRAMLNKISSKKIGNKVIESALKFIEQNYYKDLSLETVAGNVYVTPSYLSLLFKQVMGINFVDYLHKIRIERACEMLKDIRMKAYEVSLKVGYNDEKYFSQIFKKITGMTPSQYRDTFAV